MPEVTSYILSVSLSLSLTHTGPHTHTRPHTHQLHVGNTHKLVCNILIGSDGSSVYANKHIDVIMQ
jgi:hypothetical protein